MKVRFFPKTSWARSFSHVYIVALLASSALGDNVSSARFKGLNSNENSVIIDPSEAADLLNVDVSPGGGSILKRDGYGLYRNVPTFKAMHGGYHFFDSSGNDVQIWGSSTSLYGIVADATPTQLISSATLNSTWDCADTQQNAYCVNSNRDMYLQTNGTTKTWYTAPLGTMVESTPDRVVVAGVSGAQNTLYVSQSNTFTNFTTGVNATDAFTEVIASPGSRITHIRWGCGKLLWWKDASFGYFDFDDQYVAQVKTVSDVIGTFDNTSAIDPGGQVWFRGQDGHTYRYDCSSLEKMSVDITPNVQASGRRTANAWTQSSQSEWQAGSFVPSGNFSTTVSAGDVTPSTFSVTENSSSSWVLGSTSALTVSAGSIGLTTYLSDTFSNMSNWTQVCGTVGTGSGYADFQSANHVFNETAISSPTGHFITQFDFSDTDATANNEVFSTIISTSINQGLSNGGYVLFIRAKTIGNIFEVYLTSTTGVNGYWNDGAITCNSPGFSGPPTVYISSFSVSYDTSIHALKLVRDNTTGLMSMFLDGTLKTANTNTALSTFKNVSFAATQATGLGHWHLDNFSLRAGTGTFTSQPFDTSITSTVVLGQVNWTVNISTPYFEMQSASNSTTGPWYAIATTSGTNGNGHRYVRYISTFTSTPTETSLTTINSVTLVVKSTGGYFLSAVKNAPNISAWSTFGATTLSDGGSHAFSIRAGNGSFDVTSSTPQWVSQSNGALISTATGAYFQIKDTFTVTSATASLALEDFTVNWFEGSAADQAYMLYFDNAIWESVAFGSGQSTNNYIFKYDLINQAWTLYNIANNGMLVQANTLYFGDSAATGNIYNFGTVTADSGTAITAYWKSKDFSGQDPFLQNSLTQIDTFAKKNAGATLTATYTTDTSTSTVYSISLSTSNAIVQNRKLLPSGKDGYVFNIKYGDTSTSSTWELFGYRIMFRQNAYRPTQ